MSEISQDGGDLVGVGEANKTDLMSEMTQGDLDMFLANKTI